MLKKPTINKKFKVHGITTDKEVVAQETLTLQEHEVQTKYLMLAHNKFRKHETVLCPGYFNKKTNFIIGEVRSLFAVNKYLDIIEQDTSDLIENDHFLLYPIPALTMENNSTLNYKEDTTSQEVILDRAFGKAIGCYLSGEIDYEDLFNFAPKGFLRLFIDTRRGLSLNKNVLLNSNYGFCLGILKGYYDANNEKAIYINANVNIYTFTVILNYLGASYSIRNAKDSRKKLFIQLPHFFRPYINSLFIKPKSYYMINGELELKDEFPLLEVQTDLAKNINSGKVLAIPTSAILFDKLDNSEFNRMYDATSERHDATNYAMPMTPFLKNSDGDILAASGIFTKEGLESAKAFSPDNKEYYKNLNDGNINQWIADDAVLGLYNATKQK